MSEYRKDDLSRFFRKASQKPDINFHEEDWTKLEAMLDKASAQDASANLFRRKAAVITIVSLLFLSTATYFLVAKTDLIAANKVESAAIASKNKKVKNSSDVASVNAFHTPASAGGKKRAAILSQHSQHSNLSEIKPVDIDKEVTASSIQTSSEITTSKNNTLKESNTGIVSNRNTAGLTTLNGASIVQTNSTNSERTVKTVIEDKIIKEKKIDNGHPTQFSTGETNDAFLPVSEKTATTLLASSKSEKQEEVAHVVVTKPIASSSDSSSVTMDKDSILAMKKEAIKLNKTDTASDENKSMQQLSHLSLLLSFSPDFSSNGLKHFTTPGEALGVTAYYQISKNFSVLAGVIGNNKKYLSYGKEYKPNESHYWSKHTNGVLPEEIQGSCYMLEIPLGLQYTIVNMKRSRLLVSGMLSSYIMFNESYTYSFENENPGAAQGWKSTKTTTYPFSIAGASMSYERIVSNHLAFGFSPYLKVPLRAMGNWASMKLYTFGAAFTIRYTLKKKKLPDRTALRQRSD